MDPLFSVEFVPATYRDWVAAAGLTIADEQRMIRIYMPRTTERLVGRIDVVVLANANRDAIGPRNIELLYRGFQETDLGLFMSGGWESFGGSGSGYPGWDDTSVGGLLFMLGALGSLGAVIVGQAWALRGYLVSGLPGRAPRAVHPSEVIVAFGITVGVTLLTGIIAMRSAEARMDAKR